VRRREPTAYFGQESGIGLALNYFRRPALRVGILGLGAGTIATYGRSGDVYRFYEINPAIVDVANREFTYLRDSEARVETVLGDARLSLEGEPPQHFDILAMDVFSGDMIPVHLLSREAMQLYVRHLKPDGILAVNITNIYIELSPILDMAARSLGREAWKIENGSDPTRNTSAATWILVGPSAAFASRPELRARASKLDTRTDLRMWTDDYTNLIQVLK
jgi:spermidine synthase